MQCSPTENYLHSDGWEIRGSFPTSWPTWRPDKYPLLPLLYRPVNTTISKTTDHGQRQRQVNKSFRTMLACFPSINIWFRAAGSTFRPTSSIEHDCIYSLGLTNLPQIPWAIPLCFLQWMLNQQVVEELPKIVSVV